MNDGSEVTLNQVLASKRGAAGEIVNVDEAQVKVVVFTLDIYWYAFRARSIREVLSEVPVFRLPQCPPSLEGVINVRGDIESVIGLRNVLGYPDLPDGARSRVLLGQGAGMRSGLRVDRVEEVLDVPQSALLPPPHTIPERLRDIVQSVFHFRDRPVTVLDLDRLFEDYRAGLR